MEIFLSLIFDSFAPIVSEKKLRLGEFLTVSGADSRREKLFPSVEGRKKMGRK